MSEQQQRPRRPSDPDKNEEPDRHEEPGKTEDDSPVERYRNSPGFAASRPLGEAGEVPEPNEPG